MTKNKIVCVSADIKEEGIFYPSYLAEIFISSQKSLQFYCQYQNFINEHQKKNKEQAKKLKTYKVKKGKGQINF